MLCENCGAQMSDDAGFCPSCRSKISAGQTAGREAAQVAASGSYSQIHDALKKDRARKAKKGIIITVSAVVGFFLLCTLIVYVIWPNLPERTYDESELPSYAEYEHDPSVSAMRGPISGEYVTEGGSRLTFIEEGAGNNWVEGTVLVEFAADAEYLLGGRENNAAYKYTFSLEGLPIPYDNADDFKLSDGREAFASCKSDYWIFGDVSLRLTPYSPEGGRLIFERVVPEGGGYDLVLPGESGYFDYERQED